MKGHFTRVLVIGAGLIGTSMALALRRAHGTILVDAVERHDAYRSEAQRLGVFHCVWPDITAVSPDYELAVLAIPSRAACDLAETVSELADLTMDVCSIKRPIVDAFSRIMANGRQCVPTHPMAGKANGGPGAADADLFVARPWLFLETHPAPPELEQMVADLGAIPTYVRCADDHDRNLAYLSHGIHVTSLAAMQAATGVDCDVAARIAGPAFWDITRLAASPSAFWVDTLLDNRNFVLGFLERLQAEVRQFAEALQAGNAESLRELLDQARASRERVESARGKARTETSD
ncbi:hypothetical protein SD51_09060 [Alicyclobacillus tengchongensis]|nr:hypothetical protein SD51_09060 [Alicyclobacillus tengchongensis]